MVTECLSNKSQSQTAACRCRCFRTMGKSSSGTGGLGGTCCVKYQASKPSQHPRRSQASILVCWVVGICIPLAAWRPWRDGPLQRLRCRFRLSRLKNGRGARGLSSSIILFSAVVIFCDMACFDASRAASSLGPKLLSSLGIGFSKSRCQPMSHMVQLLQPSAAIESEEWQACRHGRRGADLNNGNYSRGEPGSRGAAGLSLQEGLRAKNAKAGTNARSHGRGPQRNPTERLGTSAAVQSK
jgi:hypothetical protein